MKAHLKSLVALRRPGTWCVVATSCIGACQPDDASRSLDSFVDGTCAIPEVNQEEGRIRLELAAQLGTDDSENAALIPVPGATHPVRDRLGRYWVGQTGELLLFEPGGSYAATVGRKGQGPLEFLDALPFYVDPLDQVHVLDPENGRVSVIRQDLSLAAAISLPAWVHDIVPLSEGDRYAFTSWITDGESAGFPIHVLDGGGIVRSIGALPDDQSSEAAGDVLVASMYLAKGAGDLLFSAHRDRYVVDAWRSDGSSAGRLEGPVLNGRAEASQLPGDAQPPPNIIKDIHVDDDERLWVIAAFTRSNWRDAMIERVAPDGSVIFVPADMDAVGRIWRFRLDVIDLGACRAVASQWLDRPTSLGFGSFLPSRDVVSLTDGMYGDLGALLVNIWNVELITSSSGTRPGT